MESYAQEREKACLHAKKFSDRDQPKLTGSDLEMQFSLNPTGGRIYSDVIATLNSDSREKANTKPSQKQTATSQSTESYHLVQFATRIPDSLTRKIAEYCVVSRITRQEFTCRAFEAYLNIQPVTPTVRLLGEVEVITVDGQEVLDRRCPVCKGGGKDPRDGLRCSPCQGNGRFYDYPSPGGVRLGVEVK